MPASTPLVLSGVAFTWPDGTPAPRPALDLLVPPAARRSSASTAPASPRSCGSSPASSRRPRARPRRRPGRLPAAGPHPRPDAPSSTSSASPRPCARCARIEAGSVDPADYDAVGDDWDVEERAVATLARLGLPDDVLDRRLGELSGGEVVQLGLARLLLAGPTCCCSTSRPTTSTPRARARLLDLARPWRARCSWSATTVSCSSTSTGSATCATARCAGTAAAGRRTPSRSRPSRRPPSRRSSRRASDVRRQQADRRRPSGCWPSAAAGRAQRRAHQHGQGRPGLLARTARRRTPRSYRRVHDERLERARERLDAGRVPAARGPRDPRRPARHRGAARAGRADHPRPGPAHRRARSTSTSAAPTGSRWSGPTARARRRCCTRSPGCSRRAAGTVAYAGAGRAAPPAPRRARRRPQRLRQRPAARPASTDRGARRAGPLPVPRRAADRPAGTLSGGERFRASLAAGAAGRPGAAAAAARRADQQPRPRVVRRPGVGAGRPTAARCSWSATTRRSSTTSASTGPWGSGSWRDELLPCDAGETQAVLLTGRRRGRRRHRCLAEILGRPSDSSRSVSVTPTVTRPTCARRRAVEALTPATRQRAASGRGRGTAPTGAGRRDAVEVPGSP